MVDHQVVNQQLNHKVFIGMGTPYEVPGLPKSWEELQELIEDGEQEYERGEAIPWETATKRMKTHIKEYAAYIS